jgi:hypothetical protein
VPITQLELDAGANGQISTPVTGVVIFWGKQRSDGDRRFTARHLASCLSKLTRPQSMIRFLSAPIRGIMRFPLFQLALVVGVILWLQTADDGTARGYIFGSLDKLVDSTVQLFASMFSIRSFTKSWLTSGFWIAYVYLACLLMLALLRALIRLIIEVTARSNLFGLRTMIARERGIGAYQAWLPLERIRPANIPQNVWEERFAWPAGDKPPYRPLIQRVTLALLSYAVGLFLIGLAIQQFAPAVFAWLLEMGKELVASIRVRI